MLLIYGVGAWYLQVKAWLADGKDVRLGEWKAADIEILNTFQLLTAKPVVYLVRLFFSPITKWIEFSLGSVELAMITVYFMYLY